MLSCEEKVFFIQFLNTITIIIIIIIIIIISLCHDGVTLLANYDPNSVLNVERFFIRI